MWLRRPSQISHENLNQNDQRATRFGFQRQILEQTVSSSKHATIRDHELDFKDEELSSLSHNKLKIDSKRKSKQDAIRDGFLDGSRIDFKPIGDA